jgi:hypothetical protein
MKTNWNSEGLTGSLVLLPAILNEKFSCFHLNTQNLHFCSQEISSLDVIGLWVVFSFPQQTKVTRYKWRTSAKHALRTQHACSPGFTNWYSTKSNASFSERTRLKTWLRWHIINRINTVTIFVIHCHLLICIVGFVTIAVCWMNGYDLCKISTLIYSIKFSSNAIISFIYWICWDRTREDQSICLRSHHKGLFNIIKLFIPMC